MIIPTNGFINGFGPPLGNLKTPLRIMPGELLVNDFAYMTCIWKYFAADTRVVPNPIKISD